VELPPILRQTVKSQKSLNGDLTDGIVSKLGATPNDRVLLREDIVSQRTF
jgi:hypothetical protein